MKKIGLLSLAIVLALGALGVGYAAWTDTVTINGTVNTGSVDILVVDTSNTWVLKLPDHGIQIWHTLDSLEPEVMPLAGGSWDHTPPAFPVGNSLIAFADADKTADDTVQVTIDNAFPTGLDPITQVPQFRCDMILHYVGSIPVIADADLDSYTGDAALANVAVVKFFRLPDYPGSGPVAGYIGPEITGPVQLHYCDYVLAVLSLDIPQDPTYMNLSGSFAAHITVIQWNEYVWPTP